METLEERRTQARLNMAYKIINGLVILEPKSLPKFTSKRMQRGCNFAKVGIENQLLEPQARLNSIYFIYLYFRDDLTADIGPRTICTKTDTKVQIHLHDMY